MKKIILVASAVLSLGMDVAFAQGLPAGSAPPVYGSHAFSNRPRQTGTIFSEIFGHSKSVQTAADRTVRRNVAPARDG
jgi:hypothetical protein